MSLKIRRFIGYWFMLLLGIFLLTWQARKYILGNFSSDWIQLTIEAVITCVSIIMILQPLALIEVIQKIVKFKYEKNINE